MNACVMERRYGGFYAVLFLLAALCIYGCSGTSSEEKEPAGKHNAAYADGDLIPVENHDGKWGFLDKAKGGCTGCCATCSMCSHGGAYPASKTEKPSADKKE